MKIDKSVFTAEELAQYEALIAKAKVDPAAAKEGSEEEVPPAAPKKTQKAEVDTVEDTKKSAPAEPEVPQFVKDAIAKSEKFIEDAQKAEIATVAKKYELLNGNTDQLADQLYNLKKSSPEMYETCISMLDSQLATIEKAGIFAEIGKSASNGAAGGGAVAKAEAKAAEIMKSDSSMDYDTAIAKAWEDPALMAEYDAEYRG